MKMVTYIAGCNHKPGAHGRLLALPNGQPLELKRESDNKFDKNAVAVYHGALQLGYVPATEAPSAAKALDLGYLVTAVLDKRIASTGLVVSWDSEVPCA